MKRFTVLAFCLISPVAVPISVVDGQTNLPVVQNGSQVAANGRFHATSMRPNSPVARNIARGPVSYGPRTNNAYAPRIASQEAVNLRPNYSHFMQPLSPTLAAMSARHLARPDNVQPNRDVLPRSEIVQTALPITNPQRVVRTDNLQPTSGNLAKREISEGLETINTQPVARIVLAILMHSALIGTNGMIAIGGDNIATRSFSSAGDIISWTEAIGIRLGVTIRSTITTITMAPSTLMVICCPMR